MFDASLFRPNLIPSSPGVYLYRDRFGTIIYIGKARNLRKRMSQYFQASKQRLSDPKFRSLINSISHYEYHCVKTEDEALILESKLIKDYMPRYNILMRDDKRFQLIRMNLHEALPALSLCRFERQDNARYWGPFPHGVALKETVQFLTRFFKLRSCKTSTPDADTYKHCLSAKVKDCTAPCIGKVSEEEYQKQVESMLKVLEGSITPLCKTLENKMKEYAEKQQFEKAARTRDIIENLQIVFGQKNRSFKHAKAPALTGMNAVHELQQLLKLPVPPRRIEGFDNSHISGHFPVSSMVCFIDGKPAPSKYRRFKLKTAIEGYPNDYAAMREVLTRNYSRRLIEGGEMPDLILVDGGKGQLHIALDVLKELGLEHLPVIGLAERNEYIYQPHNPDPIILERHNIALRLLQAVRDEVHRFVISYNRNLRQQKMTESILDDIEGIGEQRKIQLLQAYGSIHAIRKSTPEEIAKRVAGLGITLATKIHEILQKKPKQGGRIINEVRPD